MGTTNYYNTLIEVAEDCPVTQGEIPPVRGSKKSAANLQYEILSAHPYEYTSDDVLFTVYTIRQGIPEAERSEQRQQFFARDQACFRASPLPKRYGWGVHSNAEGKIAIYGVESADYQRLLADDSVVKQRAMRSKRR